VRAGGRDFESQTDFLEDEVWSLENLLIREPEDHDAVGSKRFLSFVIGPASWTGAVHATVDLDGESGAGAVEIDDERPDRVLSAELVTVEATAAKQPPQGPLCIRCCPAERSSRFSDAPG